MAFIRRLHLAAWPIRAAAVTLLAGAALVAPRAHAHDSWLSPGREVAATGHTTIELATGNRYPLQEFSQTAGSVARSGCVGAQGGRVDLRPAREQPHRLDLDAVAPDAALQPVACWVELHTAEVVIEPRIVQVYFRDIHASDSIRQTWSQLQALQAPWHERYRKFARIELAAAESLQPEQLAAARRPVGLDLEIVILGDRPVQVSEPMRLQVLRDGKPLADLPVELVSERSPLGVWQVTDAQGTLTYRLPFGGRWLFRATDLRPAQDEPQSWASRFVTLAIEAR